MAALYAPEADEPPLLLLRPDTTADLEAALLRECLARLDRLAAGEDAGFLSLDASSGRALALLTATVSPPDQDAPAE